MARCAHSECRQWRPGLLVRAAGLGLFLDDAWYCSPQCLGTAVRHRLAHAAPVAPSVTPTSSQPRLGGVLAVQKRLAPDLLEQAAAAQERTGLRIGMQLVELGVVSTFDVLKALAAQNGIGFLTSLDPGRLTNAPGNLSLAVVRALGVIPFEADRRHDVLKVACMAPVPRGSLAALRDLTGSIIEPYLVADDQWPALLKAYGSGSAAGVPTPTLVTDLESLAARVAEAARRSRSGHMSEARCDDKLWVRLDAGGQVEELLLTRPTSLRYARSAAGETRAAASARPKRARQPRPRRVPVAAGAITEPASASVLAPAQTIASAG
jgi:hypothetical protein